MRRLMVSLLIFLNLVLFLSNATGLEVGENIRIVFSFGKDFFHFKAEIVHASEIANNAGYGVRFVEMTDINKYQIAFIIKMFAKKTLSWYRVDRYV